jgi:hypothetical protein
MINAADPFHPFGSTEESAFRSEDRQTWTPLLPVPRDAPPLERARIERCARPGFVATAQWEYRSEEGEVLLTVVRYDGSTNGLSLAKDIRPFTFGYGQDGVKQWRNKAIPMDRPLYRLDALAQRPDAPVLVVEGEKAADAAQIRFPNYVVTTSSGGAHASAKTQWGPLFGRRVTLWPDADDAGRRYAEQVTFLLQEVGAAAVAIVGIPSKWPEGWDLADELPPGVTDGMLATMIAGADSAIEEPLPLFPPLARVEPYPANSLSPILSSAVAAIARKVQVPIAMAAQSVLGAAALVAQAHADVRLPFGQTRPLSLFFVTIAASGDRKTTADNEALWPIRKREAWLKEEHERAMASWMIEHAAWTAQRKKIEGGGKLTFEQRKDELRKLGTEPTKPLLPLLTTPDPTIEGLAKACINAPASLGLFTAEGGLFVGGHGMSEDNKLRTAAALSELWDGKPIKRLRAMDGVTLLFGRRLAFHLMVQPAAASLFLADGTLKDQGLLSRVLVASPESLAGQRIYREAAQEDEAAIRAYGARILSLAERKWPLKDGTPNELEPRVLPLSSNAKEVWVRFADHVERQCGRNGDLAAVADLAAKAAEHAARIAGVITLVEDPDAPEIDEAGMKRGAALADWYLLEALRLAHAGRADPRLLKAQELLAWLQRQDGDVSLRTILQFGPGSLRHKHAAEAALTILVRHGWVREISRTPRKLRVFKTGGA